MKTGKLRTYLLGSALVAVLALAVVLTTTTTPSVDAIDMGGCTCGAFKSTPVKTIIDYDDCMWAINRLRGSLLTSTGCNGDYCYSSAINYTDTCHETYPGSGVWTVSGYLNYQCMNC